MYRTDSIVRRSSALQLTPENQKSQLARMNSQEAEKQGVIAGPIVISSADNKASMILEIDDNIADACIYLATAIDSTIPLGNSFADVSINNSDAGAQS